MTTLAIGLLPQDVPDCSKDLNLMPFHIEYSGLAPIGTYFHVKDHNAGVAGTEPADGSTTSENSGPTGEETSVESKGTPVQTQSDDPAMDAMDADSTTQRTDVSHASYPNHTLPTPASDVVKTTASLKRRFIAAFRGRQIHGLKVDLPVGYRGIVLRGDENGKGDNDAIKQKDTEKRARGKVTSRKRKATRQEALDIEEDMEKQDDFHLDDLESESHRVLTPSATFNSFVLWNPDIPVDEGRDEYVRSLNEWTRLADVVSLYLTCSMYALI
jgi:hypothetical protein